MFFEVVWIRGDLRGDGNASLTALVAMSVRYDFGGWASAIVRAELDVRRNRNEWDIL